jgi:hypothetical protein
VERPSVLSHELRNFPRDRSEGFISLGLFRLSGAIGQFLFDSAVSWFEPAQSQLRC